MLPMFRVKKHSDLRIRLTKDFSTRIHFLSAKGMIGLHHSKAESDNAVPENEGNSDGKEESMPRD